MSNVKSVAIGVQDNSNLFTVLQRGDRRIAQIKKKCIILVGMTRAGKSTTYNWIRRLIMRGVENKYGTNTHFQVVAQGSNDKAASGSTLTSVTLAPNIYHLDDQTTLIDLPGYQDKRNYIGVMGVSYFLKAVFEQAEEVKFVIVFDEQKFLDSTGDGILKTFNGFLGMFNYQYMTDTVKENFLSSISVVVTRAENPTKHFNMMMSISEQLKDEALISDNKDSIIQLIDSIIPSNRIEPFLKARKDDQAPPCNFIDRFNDELGWTYFPLKKNQAKLGKQLMSIPFKRDYNNLPGQQQIDLNQAIMGRIKSYSRYSFILKSAMHRFLQNWNEFISGVNTSTKASLDSIFDLSPIFDQQITAFLQVNDKYNSQQLIERTIKVEYGTTNIITAIKAMINIYSIASKAIEQQGTFNQNMKAYSTYFSNFVDCLQPFCRNAEDQMLLLRLQVVVKRGFLEFSRFHAIDQSKISIANHQMKDNCNNFFVQNGKRQYMENFIKPANIKLLRYLFRTLPEIQEFDYLFNDYLNDYRYVSAHEKQMEDQLTYSQIRISIDFVKADILLAAGEKIKAALAFISAFKSLCSQESIVRSVVINQQELEVRLGAHFMRKLQFIAKIVGILRTLDIAVKPLAKFHALHVSQHIKDIHMSCSIFDDLLRDTEATLEKQLPILDDYIHYCIEWGRFDDANKLLQRRLSLEKDNYEAYLHVIRRIDEFNKGRVKLEQDYHGKINFWKRLADKDQVLEQQFDEIDAYLQN